MIIKVTKSIDLSKKLRKQKKTIVIVGGCFDILHIGHAKFLKASKKLGDILFVLLESDKNVRKLKGRGRPVNPQKDRAEILSNLKSVDYVVLLTNMKSDKDYDKLINQLSPNIIATTKNDPGIAHKIRQAEMINGKVKEVIDRLDNSSSILAKNILLKK